jgi:perosamine synthetase
MRERYHHEILGYNFRMTDIAAAIGLVQLDKLERTPPAARRSPALRRRSADLPIKLPTWPDGRTHVFHQYTLGVGSARDQIVADMKDAGVICGIYYPIPVPPPGVRHGAWASRRTCPEHRCAAAASLSLPMYPGLTEAEQDQVVEALRASVLRHAVAQSPASTSIACRSAVTRVRARSCTLRSTEPFWLERCSPRRELTPAATTV